MSSRLLPTDDPTLVCDRDASDAVAQWRDRWRELAVKPVGSLAEAVLARGTPGINCETSELLSRAIAEAADVPVVLHGRLSRADLPAGTVREEQLFDIVPYENTVVRLSVTVEQLEDLVEEQLESRGTYVFCGLFGVHVTVDGTGEAQVRKADLAALGSTLRNGRLRIAVNSYTASGGGGRFPLMRRLVDDPDSRAGDTGLLTRDAVRTFLAHHPDLTVEARNWLRVRRAGAPRRQETEAR
jgi:2',3'-cyclic-nucleotide 2'-phosphodiesterase (5'-nucleotidase family)